MSMMQTRRRFLTTASLAGAAGTALVPKVHAKEGPLETTTVQIVKNAGICLAPQYVADRLLAAEGFTDVRYVAQGLGNDLSLKVGLGDADFTLDFAVRTIQTIDSGGAIKVLSGVHVGCYELIAKEEIRRVSDLKGKTIGMEIGGLNPQAFLIAMAAHVGLDPHADIHWLIRTDPSVKPLQLFMDGKIDAFFATPPEPQLLHERGFNHVIFNSILDKPWSGYFCCVLGGNRQFVRQYPVATKRVLRAILKASDLCASEPARVARQLVDEHFTDRYDFALQAMQDIPYDKWREYDPEDTIRYYAFRLYEAQIVTSTPQKIIAEGTDWRFLNELKRELKA
jgi:NitT/TauT family transport system substrate-binding protein